MENFKPNLIPNSPKDGSFDMDKVILKNGGYDKYLILFKKDGVRVQLIDGHVLSRALKSPGSKLVINRFLEVANRLEELGISIDGEFYTHGQKFNSIFRFFSKSDVTCPKYRLELEKAMQKDPIKFKKEYDGLSIDYLTQFHDDLKLWLFDGILLDAPEITGYFDRMVEIRKRLIDANWVPDYMTPPEFYQVSSKEELQALYEDALSQGYEGLVLTHKDHKYKFGRNSLNEGTLLKMKDDAQEFDGIVLDVVEATSVKEGVETTKNELGNSVTSKKKDDREPSGLAKGLIVTFSKEDGTCVGTFTVGLNGFDHPMRKEMLENKAQYIGKHFKYKAMAPVKDFPRHAFFDCWRDSK